MSVSDGISYDVMFCDARSSGWAIEVDRGGWRNRENWARINYTYAILKSGNESSGRLRWLVSRGVVELVNGGCRSSGKEMRPYLDWKPGVSMTQQELLTFLLVEGHVQGPPSSLLVTGATL
jgi:hypothetical protein